MSIEDKATAERQAPLCEFAETLRAAIVAAEAGQQGWAVEQGGGGTRILRKGRLVLSGFDGDMPSDHWFMVALYRKPDDVEPLWSLADGTAEWPDCGPAVDIRAAIAAAERQALAYEFAETLRAYLTADQWRLMCLRNVDYPDGICASHDFCDANTAMLEAFTAAIGREFQTDDAPPSDTDMVIWNDAWAIAKAAYLTAAE